MESNGVVFPVLVVTFFLLFHTDRTSALVCFHCSDTGGNPDCQNYLALTKSARNFGDLTRNCTVEKYCMIEKFVQKGSVNSFIRDCTNNQNDSYSAGKPGRLKYLKPDNATVCTFDPSSMDQICISLCTEDLCNGPSGAEIPTAHGIRCYYCHGTSGVDSACEQNMKGLLDSANGDGDMAKNCTDSKYCMIEIFKQPLISTFSFIRDCSNNDSYSFKLKYPATVRLPTLSDVSANKTVCGRDSTNVFTVCVLLCGADFCNGPKTMAASASPKQHMKYDYLLLQVFLCLVVFHK